MRSRIRVHAPPCRRATDDTSRYVAGRTRPDWYANTTSCARSRACSLTIARLTWVRAVAGLTTSSSGDLVVRQALRDERDDLALTIGEHVHRRRGEVGPRRPRRELLDQPAGHAGRQQRLTGRDLPHGPDEVSRLGVLHEEAAGPQPHGLEHVLVQLERGEHEHAGRPSSAGSPVICRRASRPSTPGIRMSISTTSGPRVAHEVEGGRAVVGLADDLDVVLGVEEHAEPGAHERLVVGQHDPDHDRPSHVAPHQEAAARLGPGLEAPAGRLGPLAHAPQPQPAAVRRPDRHRRRRRATSTVRSTVGRDAARRRTSRAWRRRGGRRS